jgi:ubiquitin carboxyl-terminal hydrolase 7
MLQVPSFQVYIRRSELQNILCEVTDRDIPEELVQRLNAEKSLEIVKRREKTEAHLYMTVRLLFEDMFFGHQVQTLSGPDYVNF